MDSFPPFIKFVILAGIFFIIIQWVNTFIALRKEQNELLREIIKKMDNKTDIESAGK